MVLALVLGILVGIALGLRFKVFVLVPAFALAVIFALTIRIAHSDSFWSVVLAMVIIWLNIQLGYLVGIFLRPVSRGGSLPIQPHGRITLTTADET
jgi:hypothetical protein